MIRLVSITTLAAVLIAGCESSEEAWSGDVGLPLSDPMTRAVRLETDGCGFASGRTGSGVAIGGGLVVTVAHLIVEAESVRAYVDGREYENVPVAAVDRHLDLAVLRIPSDGSPDIETSWAQKGARGFIAGGAASGTVPFEVKGVVDLTIEEVLGTTRHSRRGYELSAVTGGGDSGAGAYDEDGRLIGIVFATGQDGATTWLTASSEITRFLLTVGHSDVYPLCSQTS